MKQNKGNHVRILEIRASMGIIIFGTPELEEDVEGHGYCVFGAEYYQKINK